jgi:hypothetical protein
LAAGHGKTDNSALAGRENDPYRRFFIDDDALPSYGNVHDLGVCGLAALPTTPESHYLAGEHRESTDQEVAQSASSEADTPVVQQLGQMVKLVRFMMLQVPCSTPSQ